MAVLSNPKWELFAQAIAKGKNATEAYVCAGYDDQLSNAAAASRLLKSVKVRDRVDELLIRAADRVEVDKSWIMARLKENVERAMQINAVLDSEGNPTGEYRYEGNVANRALELLGKELSMFIERAEVGGPGDFARMHDDELARFIEERTGALGGLMGNRQLN